VLPAGPRAGVYFNLIAEQASPQTRFEQAIAMLFPSAVVVGASALHEAGWISQIPRQLDVAVLRRRTFPALNGVALHPRSIVWYRLVQQWLERIAGQALPRLDPAFALADALKYGDGWVPDRDDVEFPQAEDARRSLDASRTLKVNLAREWLSRAASADSDRTAD